LQQDIKISENTGRSFGKKEDFLTGRQWISNLFADMESLHDPAEMKDLEKDSTAFGRKRLQNREKHYDHR